MADNETTGTGHKGKLDRLPFSEEINRWIVDRTLKILPAGTTREDAEKVSLDVFNEWRTKSTEELRKDPNIDEVFRHGREM